MSLPRAMVSGEVEETKASVATMSRSVMSSRRDGADRRRVVEREELLRLRLHIERGRIGNLLLRQFLSGLAQIGLRHLADLESSRPPDLAYHRPGHLLPFGRLDQAKNGHV